jgi:hypothetical protein
VNLGAIRGHLSAISRRVHHSSPAVRLGFVVAPGPLAELIAALRPLIDWHAPTATQTAQAGFIDDGLLDKHLRRARRVYAERHYLHTQALSGPLDGLYRFKTWHRGRVLRFGQTGRLRQDRGSCASGCPA